MLKKAFLTNSSGILCSRVFGFLRDLSMANILGAGVYSDIFFVAFKFPNLFRRIFGEGAFTQSFLPSFIASSKKGAFSVLVLAIFSCVLIGFSLLVVAFSGAFTRVLALGFDEELIRLASPIVAIHFWYLFLVFLVTFFSTLLQYKQHFWVSAYNTALLNIAMICALLFARDSDEMQIVYIASYGVLVGGVAQIALHIYPLYRLGFVRLFVCGVGEVRLAFFTRDSALRDKSGISSPRCVDRHSSLISLRGSKNPNFSSQSVASLENKRSEVSLENPQSSHSPTAIPRILEEEKGAGCEKSAANQKVDSSNEAFLSSLRADLSARQSTQTKTQNLESTFDKNAKNIQTLQKADSSPNAHFSVIASRDSGVAIHKGAKVDSSNDYSASAESVDSKETSANAERYPLFSKEATLCHTTATAAARNDRRNAESQKVDSSNAQSVFSQNAVRRQDFGDKNGALQGESRAHTRAYVTADSPQQSPFLAQKPTPESSKAQSSSKKPTPKSTKLAHTIRTELRAFFKQFFPAMLGSSTAQIASFIDTILASFLASGAISYLYYANRIFQLPLAIFAIAISTALFPMVAKAIKAGQEQKALLAMKRAFWFLLFMLLVCAVGGIMLREQIIWLLYEHGKFSRADTLECAMVFGAYMAGLVPFGCARIFSLYLYSHSKQALAAKISAISLLVGVVFSLVLMQFWGAFGLALAGSLSGFVLFALTIRAFGFGEFWAIICARNYALWLGVVLVCEVLLLMLWLHYIHI
ncbi:virulence factor [Helicobacter canis]|uniref:Probable lipid II flippase MurJ n=1 Tax=Helicobacter canis TaxID=29419 RepID=A0A377J3X8_9HELI|nr:virulence factor [Helicobacter canis]